MRLRPLWQVLAICLSSACGDAPAMGVNAGWMEARWSGADSGKLAARTTAEWCGERGLLEIRAIQGDTGVAMVLYPVDTIDAGTYRVIRPEGADTLAPSAGVALRVFARSAIQGYQGDSGTIVLERSESGELSGTLEARARSVVNAQQQVTLAGEMRHLTVVPQSRGCGSEPGSASGDTNAERSGIEVD